LLTARPCDIHAVLIIDQNDLHLHHIAHLADVTTFSCIGQLADVAETVLAQQDLDKRRNP
jgi:hypothetical protein